MKYLHGSIFTMRSSVIIAYLLYRVYLLYIKTIMKILYLVIKSLKSKISFDRKRFVLSRNSTNTVMANAAFNISCICDKIS